MATLYEGSLAFSFPDTWRVAKYDGWAFYRNQFKDSCLGCKAVDFLAIDPDRSELWLIEVKDYRRSPREKNITMWDEMALKTLHTLAGIFAAKCNAVDEAKEIATQCLACTRLRAVLHLQQPIQHSRLFPRVFNPADVQQKIRQLLRPIDAHPRVMEMDYMQGAAWTVVSA